jgi:hypothetical protein|tara:strand:- start:278 stop:682 length:405 start_codon:yes stop_codon:yes gene_type:complete
MEFTVRKLNTTDYDDILVGWWKGWKWTPPTRDFLPENGEGGFIVLDGDTPVCAGFVYITNSKVAWCEFIISNPNYKDHRKEALSLLVETINTLCIELKMKYIYALLKSNSLIDLYSNLGYKQADSYKSEMIKVL